LPSFRHQGAEDRGTQKNPGQQLSEDGRLPDAAHALAEHPTEKQQQDQLGYKDCGCVISCHGRPRVTAGIEVRIEVTLRNCIGGRGIK